MKLKDLRDKFFGEDIYIVGSGPSAKLFPADFLDDKVCIALNDAFKIFPTIGPIALMHTEYYSRKKSKSTAEFHNYFFNIKYPVIKTHGKIKFPEEFTDWENPNYYYYDWSHDIKKIWTLTKETDTLYYTADGCSLHAAMQVAWIAGAKNIFIIGCDSTTIGGKHYANYNKNNIRANEVLKNGVQRNYDSYIYGTLVLMDFLSKKGINVLNMSPMIGYHMIDFQHSFLSGEVKIDDIYKKIDEIPSVTTTHVIKNEESGKFERTDNSN